MNESAGPSLQAHSPLGNLQGKMGAFSSSTPFRHSTYKAINFLNKEHWLKCPLKQLYLQSYPLPFEISA